MRVLAAITHPEVARRILKCLSLPPRAPPLAPAMLLVEQPPEPGMDAQDVSSQIGPEFRCDFDQTPPEEWDIDPQSAEHSTATARNSS